MSCEGSRKREHKPTFPLKIRSATHGAIPFLLAISHHLSLLANKGYKVWYKARAQRSHIQNSMRQPVSNHPWPVKIKNHSKWSLATHHFLIFTCTRENSNSSFLYEGDHTMTLSYKVFNNLTLPSKTRKKEKEYTS